MTPKTTAQTFHEDVEVRVEITINDPTVIERITGPDGDEWREQMYPSIRTERDVLEHLAFNAVSNGYERVNGLEGWSDLADDAATMRIVEVQAAL